MNPKNIFERFNKWADEGDFWTIKLLDHFTLGLVIILFSPFIILHYIIRLASGIIGHIYKFITLTAKRLGGKTK